MCIKIKKISMKIRLAGEERLCHTVSHVGLKDVWYQQQYLLTNL